MTGVVEVECYAGYRGEETPRRFHLDLQCIAIVKVLDRWLTPDHRYFKVLGDDGHQHILRYDVVTHHWQLSNTTDLSTTRLIEGATMADTDKTMSIDLPNGLDEETGQGRSLRFPVRTKDDITTLSHYYRGEMARMMSWRDRLDRTTNWAIGAVAAMLSISLATASAHHAVLIFSMVMVFLLLQIESRRYRFFHLFRTRVRLLERNYYSHFFAPEKSPEGLDWSAELSETLRNPRFTIGRRKAMARRLGRNYIWIFLILLAAWLLKITTAVLQPRTGEAEFIHSLDEFLHNTDIGYIPGEVVLAGVLIFYGWLFYVMIRHRTNEGELTFGEVHV